jgi:hypothetical protein
MFQCSPILTALFCNTGFLYVLSLHPSKYVSGTYLKVPFTCYKIGIYFLVYTFLLSDKTFPHCSTSFMLQGCHEPGPKC